MGWQNHLAEQTPTNNAPKVETPQSVISDLMNLQDTAQYLRMSVPTLRLAIRRGHLPDGVFVGNGKRWSRTLLETFLWSKFVAETNTAQNKPMPVK